MRKKATQKPSDFEQEQRYKEFAHQYLFDFKAIAAYRRCNFKVGENKASDSAAASKLLSTPEVQEYIREFAEERQRRLIVKVDRIVEEQARIAFADIRNYFTWDAGEIVLKDSAMLDENASRAIERLEMTTHESPMGEVTKRVKIKLHSKAAALEALAKHLGMYTERHDVNVTYGTVAVPALASRQDWMDVVRQEIEHVNGNNGAAKNGLAGE